VGDAAGSRFVFPQSKGCNDPSVWHLAVQRLLRVGTCDSQPVCGSRPGDGNAAALPTRRNPTTARSSLHTLTKRVPYLPHEMVLGATGRPEPKVNTDFFIDHQNLGAMRKRAARPSRTWALGMLADGEEWFAATFGSQSPDSIDEKRLAEPARTGPDVGGFPRARAILKLGFVACQSPCQSNPAGRSRTIWMSKAEGPATSSAN
jgi:hypothetical protein